MFKDRRTLSACMTVLDNSGSLFVEGTCPGTLRFLRHGIGATGRSVSKDWQPDIMQKHLGHMVRILAIVNILLMTMAGLERPDSGRIVVDGTDLAALDEDALARFRGRRIGIVFQSFHLVPTMTALENVALPLEFQDQADAADRARELLDEVGLSHRLQHFPAQLSGGEQQRVALARALVTRPRVLLADEPTGNLDGATGTHVMDLLFSAQARRNTTLVLVTHDEKLAQRCSRVVRMSDGNIVPATPEPVAA
ncbi:MAG TPA: ATP-binding cassette domain-containing protein [Hyphomicrobiaceae bacterium]